MPRDLTRQDWWIGLDGWVLQDGNYTDFAVGDVRQFALEFSYRRTERLVVDPSSTTKCDLVDASEGRYTVAGELLRSADQPMNDGYFLFEFGLLAYSNWMVLDDLNPPSAGARLSGDIWLSVDPYFWMDHYAKQPNAPALIYTWQVGEIRLDTSPSITVEYGHSLYVGPDEGPMRVRDPHRRSHRNIDATDMDADEGSYLLRCTLLDPLPAQSISRSRKRSPVGPIHNRWWSRMHKSRRRA